jgi:hypothetical protein
VAGGASLTYALAAEEKPLSDDCIDVKPVMTRPTVKVSTIARIMSGLRFMATSSDAPDAKNYRNQWDIAGSHNLE